MAEEFQFSLDVMQELQFEFYQVRPTWRVVSNKTGEIYKIYTSLRSAAIRPILNTYPYGTEMCKMTESTKGKRDDRWQNWEDHLDRTAQEK